VPEGLLEGGGTPGAARGRHALGAGGDTFTVNDITIDTTIAGEPFSVDGECLPTGISG